MHSPHMLEHILPPGEALAAVVAGGCLLLLLGMTVLHVAPQVGGAHLLPAHGTLRQPRRFLVHLGHVPPQVRLAAIGPVAQLAGGRFRAEMAHADVLLQAPLGLKDLPTVGAEVGLAARRILVTGLSGSGRQPPTLRDTAHLQPAQILITEGFRLGSLQQNQLVFFGKLGTFQASTNCFQIISKILIIPKELCNFKPELEFVKILWGPKSKVHFSARHFALVAGRCGLYPEVALKSVPVPFFKMLKF